MDLSHKSGNRLPLLSARPAVTFPAKVHQCPLAGTKLYCLVTEAHVVNNLPSLFMKVESNLRPLKCESGDLTTAPPYAINTNTIKIYKTYQAHAFSTSAYAAFLASRLCSAVLSSRVVFVEAKLMTQTIWIVILTSASLLQIIIKRRYNLETRNFMYSRVQTNLIEHFVSSYTPDCRHGLSGYILDFWLSCSFVA